MLFTTRMMAGRRLAGGLTLGALLLGSAGLAAVTAGTRAVASPAAATPTWVTTSGKTVHLTLIAGWNNNNAGFNVDGAAHGQMVITVPLGDKVIATFKNNGQGALHDAVIIRFTLPLPGNATQPVFASAASPLPRFGAGGPPSAGAAQTFSFAASQAGRYMVVCGVAGHALAGMWDTFVVSKTAKIASVSFKYRVERTLATQVAAKDVGVLGRCAVLGASSADCLRPTAD